MMTGVQRAKQFMPFDAMKGLQEALRDREERHSRVERHEISEEAQRENSYVIGCIRKRTPVRIEYYCAFHDIEREGIVTDVSMEFRYIKLGKERIAFDDIYSIKILDTPMVRE